MQDASERPAGRRRNGGQLRRQDRRYRPGFLARGTKKQALRPFQVVGIFKRFPGFPLGTNLVVNLASYQAATGLTEADFFLLRSAQPGPTGWRGPSKRSGRAPAASTR